VAVFTGISGSFEMEWVAAFVWNWWQLWTGIRSHFYYSLSFSSIPIVFTAISLAFPGFQLLLP
jgi:hypothetical protein